jgi:ribonuclease HI
MYFDGSVCGDGCGIGILLVSPRGATYSFSIRLPTTCTNNIAEYEAVHKGMELLLEAGAEAVEVFGDSKLVISQLTEEYRCESELLFPLWVQCQELIAQFRLGMATDKLSADIDSGYPYPRPKNHTRTHTHYPQRIAKRTISVTHG